MRETSERRSAAHLGMLRRDGARIPWDGNQQLPSQFPPHGAKSRPSCCRPSSSLPLQSAHVAGKRKAATSWHLSLYAARRSNRHANSTSVMPNMSKQGPYNKGPIALPNNVKSPQEPDCSSRCQVQKMRFRHPKGTQGSTHSRRSSHHTIQSSKHVSWESWKCPCICLGRRIGFGTVGAHLLLLQEAANHRCPSFSATQSGAMAANCVALVELRHAKG